MPPPTARVIATAASMRNSVEPGSAAVRDRPRRCPSAPGSSRAGWFTNGTLPQRTAVAFVPPLGGLPASTLARWRHQTGPTTPAGCDGEPPADFDADQAGPPGGREGA